MSQKPTGPPPDDQAAPPPPDDLAATPPPDDQPPAPPGSPAEAPPPGAELARPSRRGLKIAVAAVAGVAVLGVAGFAVVRLLDGDVPEVGDCLTHSDDPTQMDVTECGSDRAAWQVIGHDEGSVTEAEFTRATREDVCQAFPEWDHALWLRTNLISGDGQVVCLEQTGSGPPPA